ncbi:sulfotransferase family protein [Arcobacter sp.]|uniref:sulfotransferase family protein n=1 Tax=Arcobacter sp. TaxID=1872629 RepID=UPI003C719654
MINICSSGSSGSTLLSYILNRHDKIYCGEEIGLFSKPFLYNNYKLFSKYRQYIFSKGISSWPHFTDKSFLRNLDFYNIKRDDLFELLSDSKDFIDFANNLEESINTKNNTSIWIEKSPENIYLINSFIKLFPFSKVIHIVRDPKDVINSLIKRGLDIITAAEVWITSVANIQPFLNLKNVYEIKYEDLVTNPETEIKKLCHFLNIEFDNSLLSPKNKKNRRDKFFDSWNSNPNEEISTKSIGSYKKSNINFNKICNMKITSEYANLQNIKEYTLIELMNKYNYDYEDFLISPKKDLEKIYTKNNDLKMTEFNGIKVSNKYTFPKVEI